ncbi:MAG: hypothetical protein ORN21_05260 [Methylophilaceae bacterium]|nr:hypothetical protein [Methylophilaceae bacterium]
MSLLKQKVKQKDLDSLVEKTKPHNLLNQYGYENPDLSANLEQHKSRHELERAIQELEESKEIRKMRIAYASKIFWLILFWLIIVMSSVLLSGSHLRGFTLSDSVLIAFMTTTTVNVLGLFYIVAKWLFANNKTPTPTNNPPATANTPAPATDSSQKK